MYLVRPVLRFAARGQEGLTDRRRLLLLAVHRYDKRSLVSRKGLKTKQELVRPVLRFAAYRQEGLTGRRRLLLLAAVYMYDNSIVSF